MQYFVRLVVENLFFELFEFSGDGNDEVRGDETSEMSSSSKCKF